MNPSPLLSPLHLSFSILHLPPPHLTMKPHFRHRELLRYNLGASDYINLPTPDLPPGTTTVISSSDHSFKISQLFPPFNFKTAFLVLTLLVVFFFFTIFFIYVRRFVERRHPLPLPPFRMPQTAVDSSAKGVNQSVVGSLPAFAYRCDDKFQVDCAICLSDFEADERVKTIPFCQHVFHPECIDIWLFSHVSCPVCRSTQFFSKMGGVDGGDVAGTASVSERGLTVGNDDTWHEEYHQLLQLWWASFPRKNFDLLTHVDMKNTERLWNLEG